MLLKILDTSQDINGKEHKPKESLTKPIDVAKPKTLSFVVISSTEEINFSFQSRDERG